MGHLLTGTTELYPLHSKNLKILQKLLPDVSDIRKVGISCPRSFFYFTSWRGRALARSLALALSNKVSLTVTNSTLSKGVRPTDQPTFGFVRRLGPSLLNATLLLPHTRRGHPGRGRSTKAPLPMPTLPERARIHHTRYACAGRPMDRPQAPGSNMRSRPSTSKPSEDARNADDVEGRKQGRRKKGRTEMRCSTQDSLVRRVYGRSEVMVQGGGREGGCCAARRGGVGQSANSNSMSFM